MSTKKQTAKQARPGATKLITISAPLAEVEAWKELAKADSRSLSAWICLQLGRVCREQRRPAALEPEPAESVAHHEN
jgi:hypothetical protein